MPKTNMLELLAFVSGGPLCPGQVEFGDTAGCVVCEKFREVEIENFGEVVSSVDVEMM